MLTSSHHYSRNWRAFDAGQRKNHGSILYRIGRRKPGNLKEVGIYMFFLVNNYFVNSLEIPVGTLRGLDSDRTYQTNGSENVSYD